MRSVAVVGSGISGLLTAHGLRRAGIDVTLYSDRTAEQWLTTARPTGTAARFAPALDYERELGLNHWEAQAPRLEGAHVTFCPEPGNVLLTLAGRLHGTFGQAIDVRLQSHRWMGDLEARGGRVVVEAVSVERLDRIAAEHDLTVVAGGRAELSRLFPRHPERSVYDAPQRNLAMIMTRGAPLGFAGVPFLPAKFNLFAPIGEAFWIPYFHKDVGPSWSLLFEARAGGPMDRFGGARSGDEVLAIAKDVIRDLIPWDHAWAREMELSDPNGWLLGGVAPTIRSPVGRLPSGRAVTCVGDTAMSLDPIGGQGANNGTKMAKHLVQSVVAHGDRPFDEAFMTETFEAYYRDQGQPTVAFNNLLLEPMTAAGRQILVAQYGSDGTGGSARQRLADAFIRNFEDPRRSTAAFLDPARARALIAEHAGGSWIWPTLAGGLGVARGQIRQKLGLDPEHPRAPDAGPPAPAAGVAV
jgi:2-polyprenyl-6-methoxyphenol hydroxylase-like FAD-dependent oxidoreductase